MDEKLNFTNELKER